MTIARRDSNVVWIWIARRHNGGQVFELGLPPPSFPVAFLSWWTWHSRKFRIDVMLQVSRWQQWIYSLNPLYLFNWCLQTGFKLLLTRIRNCKYRILYYFISKVIRKYLILCPSNFQWSKKSKSLRLEHFFAQRRNYLTICCYRFKASVQKSIVLRAWTRCHCSFLSHHKTRSLVYQAILPNSKPHTPFPFQEKN